MKNKLVKEDIVIYGKGDFARLMLHYFNVDSKYNVIAFCADEEYLDNNTFCDLPLVPFKNIELVYPPNIFSIFVAVGYSNMRVKRNMYENVKLKGYYCVNYISSKAIIDSSVIIGENNVIFSNVVLEPFVKIENNNIIWSSSNISHDVNIFSHSFIASQSLVGGSSKIEDNCFIGFNTTILQNVTLQTETLIGAKSLVLKSTERYSKYIGIPAKKVLEHRKEGIKIL